MGTSRSCVCWSQYLILLPLIAGSALAVELSQSIPENGSLACSGQVLQYTCSTINASSLAWDIGPFGQGVFHSDNQVNSTIDIGEFVAVLTANDGSILSSTLTNAMIELGYNDQKVQCIGDSLVNHSSIAIADVSDICLDRSVTAVCVASMSPLNESEAIVMITLSTNDSLMCVEMYEIHFNGENETVPVDSPQANFTISNEELKTFLDGEVYLVDFEGNIGQVPCDFSIPAPTAVDMLEFDPQCDPSSQNLMVLFSWNASETRGCLDRKNIQLLYIVEFNNSIFSNNVTMETTFLLGDVPQGTALEIAITPSIPLLGLIGPPTSANITIEKSDCDASAIPTTSTNTYQYSSTSQVTSATDTAVPNAESTTPTPESPEADYDKATIIGVVVLIGVLIILLSVVISVSLYVSCRGKKSKLAITRKEDFDGTQTTEMYITYKQ